MNCEISAEAPGFRSDTIRLDDHRALDNPDVGTIYLHRMGNVEGTSISATSFNAPSEAKKAYEKGLQALQKGKTADAEKSFEKAVEVYPKFANAWLDLGRVRLKTQANAQARDAFLKAIEADSKLVGPQAELGMMAAREQNWKDTAQYLDAALKMDPIDFPQLWFVDAVANYNTQNVAAAEKSVREAVKVDALHNKNPQAHELLGVILLTKQEFAGAADELRTYIKLLPTAPDVEHVKQQLAQAESMQAASAAKPADQAKPAGQ